MLFTLNHSDQHLFMHENEKVNNSLIIMKCCVYNCIVVITES